MDSPRPRRRRITAIMGELFNKDHGPEVASAAPLLAEARTSDDPAATPAYSRLESMRLLSSASKLHLDGGGALLPREEESFTISAVHSFGSEAALADLAATAAAAQPRKPGGKGHAYHLVASGAALPKKTPPEVAALAAELQRMFKLQLGPLTIGRDIPPVLDMWCRLAAARTAHGRKAVAAAWADLARATAIVSKKMTAAEVAEVLEAQCRLARPCPRSLRLPGDMLTALADRVGAQGALRDACEDDLLRFCAAAGALMDEVAVAPGGAATSVDGWLKALARAAAVMPLIEAGMAEAARRGRRAARAVATRGGSAAVGPTLLLAAALGELAGERVGGPARCLAAAAAAAAEEADHAAAVAAAAPWWKKAALKAGAAPGEPALGTLLPSHTDTGTQQAYHLAGSAAESLAATLVPAAAPAMAPEQLTRLAAALADATAEDAGAPAHEPLRQALGAVAAEAARRTREGAGARLSRSCAREVVAACRQRLLHVKFELAAPRGGLAQALSEIEAWRSRAKAAAEAERRRREEEARAAAIGEPEAVSLEMLHPLGVETGEEVASALAAAAAAL